MSKSDSDKNAIRQNSPLIERKDIFSDLTGDKGSSLFLGKYAMSEVIAILGRRNFLKDARKRSLWPLVYDLDSSEYPLQRFMIFFKEKKPENLVVDLKIKEGLFHPKKSLIETAYPQGYQCLILEWLTLQNPLQSFSSDKPSLPGQKHPGLRLSKKVIDLFIYLARLTQKNGILVYPAYFHNALLFSRLFHFFNPEKEAEVMAVKDSFPDFSFWQLAWVVHLECLKDKENKVYKWEAEEQISPLIKDLKDYFGSKEYKKKVKEDIEKFHFDIDWDCYLKKLKSQS